MGSRIEMDRAVYEVWALSRVLRKLLSSNWTQYVQKESFNG